MKHLVAIDIETSGTNPYIHEPLVVAFAPLDEKIPTLEVYIQQKNITWSKYAKENFSKFSMRWIENAVPAEEAMKVIQNYLFQSFAGEKAIAISHNVGFDIAFLRKIAFQASLTEIPYLSHRAIDTHSLLHAVNLKRNSASQELTSDLAFEEFHIKVDPALRHTALADALATKKLYLELVKYITS